MYASGLNASLLIFNYRGVGRRRARLLSPAAPSTHPRHPKHQRCEHQDYHAAMFPDLLAAPSHTRLLPRALLLLSRASFMRGHALLLCSTGHARLAWDLFADGHAGKCTSLPLIAPPGLLLLLTMLTPCDEAPS